MEKDILETTGKEIAVPQNTQMATLQELTLAEAQKKMELYQTYVKGLLSDEDYQTIGKQQFKKKSAWRKIGMAMNISVSKVSERTEQLPNGDFAYHFDMQAQHPNGRTMPGSGSCSAYEKATWRENKWMVEDKEWNGKYYAKTGTWKEAQPNSIHNVRSTAETRAANRAISNLIAAGEVSAEEADQEQHAEQYSKPTKATVTTTATPVAQQKEDDFLAGLDEGSASNSPANSQRKERVENQTCQDCGTGTIIKNPKTGKLFCDHKCWLNK